METNKEMYEAMKRGEITFEEFENWVSDNRDDAWNSAMSYAEVLDDSIYDRNK